MPESLASGGAGRRLRLVRVRVGVTITLSLGVAITSPAETQNLLAPRHAEFPDIHFVDHMQDQRSIFGKITWRF